MASPPHDITYETFRHQLGAPLSTSLAGLELLRECLADPSVAPADLLFLVDCCLNATRTLSVALTSGVKHDEHNAACYRLLHGR